MDTQLQVEKMPLRLLLMSLLLGTAVSHAQQPRNFLQNILGTKPVDEQPMLSSVAPRFGINVASRAVKAAEHIEGGVVPLEIDGNPVKLQLQYERQQGIDLYRIRHAPDSPLRGEQVRVSWSFSQGYNESMTVDTGALQGQPLFLPNGKVPDNHFTNWGTLFYHRQANVAIGTQLAGAEPSRHARRGHSRFSRTSTLQLTTTTGHPEMEILFFAYRPSDERFWWAEWYQLRRQSDPNIPENFFPVVSAVDMSWGPGERQTVVIAPSATDAGRRMELVLIDDIGRGVVSRVPFDYELPVTRVSLEVGDWPSSLYRAIIVPAGSDVDASVVNQDEKLINVIVRPRQPSGDVLFVAPTDMWWAYATNGSHDYHGWRTGYDGSVGYSPTVMSSRRRRLNHFYYSLYDRYNDIKHFRYVDAFGRRESFSVDYATQHDVALGRVKLDDYKLVLVGNHCEFTTAESYRRFTEYMGRGGAVMIHGGDSFAVLVEYLPSLEQPRYLWQRGHMWAHLSDQPSEFRVPVLLPSDAPPDAPIVNPSRGDAVDYLNPFHNSVDYWIPGSKAVIANTAHPVIKPMGLKLGDEVPGRWGGEVDIPYEPHAWDVLIRSDRTAPAGREFGIDAFDPTPIHRVGLAIHKNLRLGMLTGENFPNVLGDERNERYREIYRRTLLHFLNSAAALTAERVAVGPSVVGPSQIAWEEPVRIEAVRYELPAFISFDDRDWHRGSAPYAHYVVEGSNDAETWFVLADRRHGPWRGVQTDVFNPTEVRYIRWRGTFSNGQRFDVRNIEAFEPQED